MLLADFGLASAEMSGPPGSVRRMRRLRSWVVRVQPLPTTSGRSASPCTNWRRGCCHCRWAAYRPQAGGWCRHHAHSADQWRHLFVISFEACCHPTPPPGRLLATSWHSSLAGPPRSWPSPLAWVALTSDDIPGACASWVDYQSLRSSQCSLSWSCLVRRGAAADCRDAGRDGGLHGRIALDRRGPRKVDWRRDRTD